MTYHEPYADRYGDAMEPRSFATADIAFTGIRGTTRGTNVTLEIQGVLYDDKNGILIFVPWNRVKQISVVP